MKTVDDILIPFYFASDLYRFISLLKPAIMSKNKRVGSGQPSRIPSKLLKKIVGEPLTRTTNCVDKIHAIIQFVTEIGIPI